MKKGIFPTERDPGLLRSPLPDGTVLDSHGDSVIGRKRAINQDRFCIVSFSLETSRESRGSSRGADSEPFETRTGFLFGVADGIGGAPAGERASQIAIGTLKAFIGEEGARLLRTGHPDGEIVETLRRGLRRCQTALLDEMRHHPEHLGLGTTLIAAVVLWPRLYLFHMGDSRAYLLREGVLRRLTRDQTYARSLVDAGVLDSKSAERSSWKHVVWNVLGGKGAGRDPEVHPEVHIKDLQAGDLLVLCSDGLTDSLSDETIRDLLLKGGSSEQLCKALTDSALERRAKDDATVLVARFADGNGEPG
jgi:serine/threonine protein phosphatase PrpC